MKQKLLNSFTWRGTLLVALLCCAFSSAWGQTTKNLVFNAPSLSNTNDGVNWTITNSSGSGENNLYVKGKTMTVKSSSLTGKITKITVNAYSQEGNKSKLNVSLGTGTSLGTIDFDEKGLSKSGENYVFPDQDDQEEFTVEDGHIQVSLTSSGANGNKTAYLYSITVTYVVPSVNTFTISPDCHGYYGETHSAINYFGTYSYEYPFKVPAAGDNDLTVSTISVLGGVLNLSALSEGTIVPANTGVLVSASSAATYDVTPTLASGTAISGNMLVASSVAMTGDNKYYCLSMKDGNIGFYYGASGGGSFTMPEHKAYLAVPTSSGSIKSFSFGDMVDGIKAVETDETESKVIYNLAGQRVSKMQKGIYVVNGKKVLVK